MISLATLIILSVHVSVNGLNDNNHDNNEKSSYDYYDTENEIWYDLSFKHYDWYARSSVRNVYLKAMMYVLFTASHLSTNTFIRL